MRATIDKAGRLVIPRALRDQLGLGPGCVEVSADGTALRIEHLEGDRLDTRAGRLIVPRTGVAIDDEVVRTLAQREQSTAGVLA